MYSQLHTFFAVFVKTFNINSTTAACASLNIKFFDLKHCRSLEFPWPNEKVLRLVPDPEKVNFPWLPHDRGKSEQHISSSIHR